MNHFSHFHRPFLNTFHFHQLLHGYNFNQHLDGCAFFVENPPKVYYNCDYESAIYNKSLKGFVKLLRTIEEFMKARCIRKEFMTIIKRFIGFIILRYSL